MPDTTSGSKPKRSGGYHRGLQRTVGREERREVQLKRTKSLVKAAYRVWALKNGITD